MGFNLLRIVLEGAKTECLLPLADALASFFLAYKFMGLFMIIGCCKKSL